MVCNIGILTTSFQVHCSYGYIVTGSPGKAFLYITVAYLQYQHTKIQSQATQSYKYKSHKFQARQIGRLLLRPTRLRFDRVYNKPKFVLYAIYHNVTMKDP